MIRQYFINMGFINLTWGLVIVVGASSSGVSCMISSTIIVITLMNLRHCKTCRSGRGPLRILSRVEEKPWE